MGVLPLNQTLSVVSVFLLFIATSIVIYSASSAYWVEERFRMETHDFGVFIAEKLPKPLNGTPAHEKSCNVITTISEYLILPKNKKGKIVVNLNAGLRDICIHFKLSNYGPIVDLLQPNMHYCKNHSFLYNYGLHWKIHKDPKQKMSVKIIDQMVDAGNESYDLIIACLTLYIVATLNAVLKTPMILSNFRLKKILQGSIFLILLGVVIAGTWCVVIFYKYFDPHKLLEQIKAEQKHRINNQALRKIVYKDLTFQQNYGHPFYLTIIGVIMALTVMVLTIAEYRLTVLLAMEKRNGNSFEQELLVNN